MPLAAWSAEFSHRLLNTPPRQWADWLWMAGFMVIFFVGMRLASRIARRHLAVHGQRTRGYWIKEGALMLGCAIAAGLYVDMIELLTRPPLPQNLWPLLLIPVAVFAAASVLVMPLFAAMTLFSLWLQKRFPAWFPSY